jgi:hypothetical protein
MTFKQVLLASCALVISATAAIAQIPSYVPTNGLVGWWPFNGNANDESGNGNHGTVNGATLTEDRNGAVNSAYNFSGTQDIAATVAGLPAGNASRTLVSWFKTSGGPNPANVNTSILGYPNILMIVGYGTSTQGHVIYPQMVYAPNGKLRFESGSGMNLLYSSSVVNDNTWHNAVTTYDNTTGTVNMYLDGVLTASGTGVNLSTPSTIIKFGNSPWANTFFIGQIDDIAIYNRALTPQEIQNLYNGTTETVDTGNGAAPLPQGIPYQAAARDAQGQVIADASVNVRFTLHEGAADGAASYAETHELTTNSVGLFNTVFGAGTPEQSAFDSINWAATTKFLQVEIDLGEGYVDMGTTQLLSVPYALRSDEAARVKNAGLPIFNDNAAAIAGGLAAGEMYRTAAGVLMVAY